jgi:hypothetical protein
VTTQAAFEVALHPSLPDRLFAATPGGGVFRSDDAGATWSPMNDGLVFKSVIGVALNPGDPNLVYAGCEGGGLHTYTISP